MLYSLSGKKNTSFLLKKKEEKIHFWTPPTHNLRKASPFRKGASRKEAHSQTLPDVLSCLYLQLPIKSLMESQDPLSPHSSHEQPDFQPPSKACSLWRLWFPFAKAVPFIATHRWISWMAFTAASQRALGWRILPPAHHCCHPPVTTLVQADSPSGTMLAGTKGCGPIPPALLFRQGPACCGGTAAATECLLFSGHSTAFISCPSHSEPNLLAKEITEK